jgi:hypothetical protein
MQDTLMKEKKVPTWLFLLIISVILVPNVEMLAGGAPKAVHLILVISTISLGGSLLSLALRRRILAHWALIIGAALSVVAVVIS